MYSSFVPAEIYSQSIHQNGQIPTVTELAIIQTQRRLGILTIMRIIKMKQAILLVTARIPNRIQSPILPIQRPTR